MSFANILAPLTGDDADRSVLVSAIEFARPFTAHVSALFVRPDPTEALPYLGEGVSVDVAKTMFDAIRDVGNRAAQRAQATMEAICAQAKVTKSDKAMRQGKVTFSYTEVEGDYGNCVAEAALLADLVVLCRPKDQERPAITTALEQVLLQAECPVLLLPGAPLAGPLSRIALGWDGRAPAAAAIRMAAPLLAYADKIEILSVQHAPLKPHATETVRDYLALHGVQCTERVVSVDKEPVGAALLGAASGADLLVMGGYGHGRLRESLIGGVTKYIIAKSPLALFLVH